MRFVIVGAGSVGRRHLRNLASLGERDLVAVDPRPDRRRAAEEEAGALTRPVFDRGLAEEAQAVFITAPTALHVETALIAARAGCHLFVEKPLSNTLDHVDELVDICRQKGLVGFVGSNWKFHPALRRMKALLEGGAIGRPVAARFSFGQYLPDWHPWEDYRETYSARRGLGGGAIFDSHELDYLTWLLGPAERVSCLAARVGDLEIETEDVAGILLRLKSGALAQVHLDYLSRAYQRRHEIWGTEGALIWDVRSGVEMYRAEEKKWDTWPADPRYDLNQMYVDEVRHFLECLRGRERPVTPLEHGRDVLKIMLAAHRSNRESRVVEL